MNNAEQMDAFCAEKGFVKWFETSAKENINIEESARFLISEVSISNVSCSDSIDFLTLLVDYETH